ncbi:MAG: protein-glutamate O-methyltransferase CheR [Chloroflexi bacterium]|nr:protein-glutamate O-methyltransferase CheR [Chloroflexota bacterium]
MDMQVYSSIKVSVKKLLNIDLEHYKDEQMRRRLDSWLVRTGMKDWESYFGLVSTNPNELLRFRNYLTINVSEFFRDNNRWDALQRSVMPRLLADAQAKRPPKALKLWSAGCSIGAEPYSLAMMLQEIAPTQEYSILATDLDRGAIDNAKNRGPYLDNIVQNMPTFYREKYMEPGGPPYFVKPKVGTRIQFKEHNMLTDTFDQNFDLIICRNVIIYFTNEAKSLLYRKFQQALRPGGILFLGGTEIIPRPQEIGFKNLEVSFYIKTE